MKDVWSNIQAVVGVAGVPSVCVFALGGCL